MFDATCIPVSRSKFKVMLGSLMLTHRVPYLLNGKAYKLQTWYTDEGRRPAPATGAMTVKVARSRDQCDQSEPCWPNAVPVSLEAGGGITCRPNLAATGPFVVCRVVHHCNNFFSLLTLTLAKIL